MRRSGAGRSAAASSAGVSYFEKSGLEATSVISSRVRWDRIVEIRTLNGSSVSATIFARAVSPVCRSPAGRYRWERSRTMNAIRSRAAVEMVKGPPRGVERARDQDEVVRSRRFERRIDRVSHRADDTGLGIRTEGRRDVLRVVGAVGLGSTGEDAAGHRPQGGGHARQVLVVQDARDEESLATGERLGHRRPEGFGRGAVVGSVDDDERGPADDLHSRGPSNGGNPRPDRFVRNREPGRAELLEGGHGDAEILHLERAE